jgi:splicing suppressor protein 51
VTGHEFKEEGFGAPSYTFNVGSNLSLTSIKAPYEEIHHQLGPFDLYNDVFFAFSPGLGFPHQGPEPVANVEAEAEAVVEANAAAEASSTGTESAEIEPPTRNNKTLVQAQTTWHHPLRLILQTKCPLFFTAFSPLDLERDVSALQSTQPPTPPSVREFPEYVNLPTNPIDRIEGVSDEFELVLAPGRNMFGSEKWEIAEWDVRVGVKTNWGVWGIRGKKYEVVDGEERE